MNLDSRTARLARCALIACLAAVSSAVHAQGYPTRAIRLVVATSPGGGTDLTARRIAPKLAELLGQPVVVENRAGASNTIGTDSVARAAPDGYTILMTVSSFVLTPFIMAKVPYDPVKDFAPISQVLVVPNLLVGHPSLPARNLKELIAYAKTRPGELHFAAGGTGTTAHLAVEQLNLLTGMKLVHVPYKGQGPGMIDLLAGHIPLMMADFMNALPRVRSGALRAYGVTSAKRAAIAPEIPTIAEAGVPGYALSQWFGLLAPAKTPPEIISKLHSATVRSLADPAIRESFASEGAELVGGTPEEFATVIREDTKKWARITKELGIKAH